MLTTVTLHNMWNKSDLITVSHGGRRQMIKAGMATAILSGDLQVISGDL